jgi:hypothetical protein
MKRKIIQTRNFAKSVDSLFKKRQLSIDDFDIFQKNLAENPSLGDIIPGTGGIRKVRLKSTSKGKSGGFRVCYYDFAQKDRLYLLLIYSKNEQENLTMEEKKFLKSLISILKGTNNE